MEYKKINKENYTIHLVNTKRFKALNIVLFFTKKFDKNDIPFGNFLCSNLVYTSKKYNTKNKMAIAGENLYGARISSFFSITGKCESFVFNLEFLNPKYTSPKYLDLSLDFLNEILFNPNIENDGFKEEYFDILKKDAISNINAVKDNPNVYASREYSKIVYKGTPSAYSSTPELKDIESITPQSLYEFYKTIFNGSYKIDIVVHGEVEENIIENIDYKFNNLIGNNDKLSFTINHKYSEDLIEKTDSLPFNQSKLYMGYRLIDMDYHELNHVLKVYNTILGTMNDSILFNIVRESNSLCYSIGSYVSVYNPLLTIYAGINKDNYEKTVSLIKECVESMSDEKVIKRLFDSAKKTINTYLNSYYDDVTSQINKYYHSEFEYKEDVESMRENINNVTIEEVMKLNDKIKLCTIYCMKGDNSSEKENI